MSRRVLRDGQRSFAGGLNTVSADIDVLPSQVRQADNARLTEYGAITKRLGTQRIHVSALPAAVRGGFTWAQASGNAELVVANGNLYTATYAIPTTWTLRAPSAGALSSSTAPSFAQFRNGSANCVYVADGGLLNVWDGTTFTTRIASTPSVAQLAVYNQRLFGISGTDETLYWSGLNNGSTLGIAASGGGTAIVRTFGAQRLTALATVEGSLLLFHVNGISRFTGWSIDDINISTGTSGVSADTGTIAPRSVIQTEGAVWFISERGLFRATAGGVTAITSPSRPDPLVPVLQQLTASGLAGIVGAHCRAQRELWFYLPDVGVYVYHYGLDAWAGPWTGGYNATGAVTTALWPSLSTQGQPQVLRGTNAGFVELCDAPSVYRDTTLTDGTGGSAFSMVVKCRRMFAGDWPREKALRMGYVLADLRGSAQAGVSWQTSRAAGSYTLPSDGTVGRWGLGTWGSGTWGGDSATSYDIQLHGSGVWADLTLTDDGLATAVYSRLEIEAFDMERR